MNFIDTLEQDKETTALDALGELAQKTALKLRPSRKTPPKRGVPWSKRWRWTNYDAPEPRNHYKDTGWPLG